MAPSTHSVDGPDGDTSCIDQGSIQEEPSGRHQHMSFRQGQEGHIAGGRNPATTWRLAVVAAAAGGQAATMQPPLWPKTTKLAFGHSCGGIAESPPPSIILAPGANTIHVFVSRSLTAYCCDPGGHNNIVRDLSPTAQLLGRLSDTSPVGRQILRICVAWAAHSWAGWRRILHSPPG